MRATVDSLLGEIKDTNGQVERLHGQRDGLLVEIEQLKNELKELAQFVERETGLLEKMKSGKEELANNIELKKKEITRLGRITENRQLLIGEYGYQILKLREIKMVENDEFKNAQQATVKAQNDLGIIIKSVRAGEKELKKQQDELDRHLSVQLKIKSENEVMKKTRNEWIQRVKEWNKKYKAELRSLENIRDDQLKKEKDIRIVILRLKRVWNIHDKDIPFPKLEWLEHQKAQGE